MILFPSAPGSFALHLHLYASFPSLSFTKCHHSSKTQGHMSNIVLITGGNKGIGFESARQLGRLPGYQVIVGARSAALGDAAVAKLKAEGVNASSVLLDVVDLGSVQAAVATIEKNFGHIDVLVNNAGVLKPNYDPTALPLADVREEFEVNFFGAVQVTTAFLPLLKKSALPRIVNLSSILGSHSEHADPASPIYGALCAGYNASKAALNMYTQNLAHALKDSNFKINAAHPGWVKTDMGGANAPLEVSEGAETTVFLATLDAAGPTGGYFHKKEPLRW